VSFDRPHSARVGRLGPGAAALRLLADAAARAGLDLAALEAAVARDPSRYDRALAVNDAALRAAGHWGVPTMVVDGEVFFGQDRFDQVKWRLEQTGLKPR